MVCRFRNFEVGLIGNCHGIVNPLIDVQTYLPSSVNQANYGYYDNPKEVAIYDKMLRETDPTKQHAEMYDFAKDVMDTQAHTAFLLWWYSIEPLRSYVHGWKIGPSHYANQDLSTIWLSPPECGECRPGPTTAQRGSGAK